MTNPETSSDLVKRLEWVDDVSVTAFGAYWIVKISKGWVGSSDIRSGIGMELSRYWPTKEEAIAYCQSDYASRVLSAIDATTIERLTAERDEALKHVEVLQAKIDPDEHCACGFDAGSDVCSHHSPIVHALQSLNARQAEVLKRVKQVAEMSLQQISSTGGPTYVVKTSADRALDAIRKHANEALATESSNG